MVYLKDHDIKNGPICLHIWGRVYGLTSTYVCATLLRDVRRNFLQLSAIFGVVTGLQHAVVKQIIRLLFGVARHLSQYSLKHGTKEEEADEALVLVSF